MAYKYRGNVHDAPTINAIPARCEPKRRGVKPKPFDPAMCGTRKGYKQHLRRDVPICDACQVASNAYMAEYMAEYNARKKVAA